MGWGESHEIGHNIQYGWTKLYDGESGEVSNSVFPMHKIEQYHIDHHITTTTGNDPKAAFDLLVAAVQSDATAAPLTGRARFWSAGGDRLMPYRQLFEYARYYDRSFTDGYELWTLQYLLQRQIWAARSSWASAKDTLGFGTYATYPDGLSGNDFMVISSSRIIGRDMRPFFDLYGLTYSDAASAQVQAYGLPSGGALFFPMRSRTASTPAEVGPPVTVTADAVYPAGY